MFKKWSGALLLSACSLNLLGCGRMVNGTKQSISISSEPEGATVSIEPGGISAVTPAEIELKRLDSYTVLVTKEGFEHELTLSQFLR